MRRLTVILAAAALLAAPAATAYADATPGATAAASQGKAVKVTVPATITAIPGTVTTVENASRGAVFVVYKLAATATALPGAQPRKGGEVRKLDRGTLAAGTLSGTLKFESVKGKVRVYAIYPSGNGTPSLVKIAADGTLTVSVPVTAVYSATAKVSDAKKVGEKKK